MRAALRATLAELPGTVALCVALLALALAGCRVTGPCCARACSSDRECVPSRWEICIAGCCTCSPPDGGTCPAALEPAGALPALDGGCP